jgi:hypothetical protein
MRVFCKKFEHKLGIPLPAICRFSRPSGLALRGFVSVVAYSLPSQGQVLTSNLASPPGQLREKTALFDFQLEDRWPGFWMPGSKWYA